MFKFQRVGAALLAGCAILWAGAATAADAPPSPHAMELSKRLLAAMHMDRTMRATMSAMLPAMKKQLDGASPDAAKFSDAFADLMNATVARMQDRMIPIYASTFTEQELTEMVAFYESSTG